MATRHTISHADTLYHGNVYHGGYSADGRRGVELSHLTFVDLGSPDTADVDAVLNGVTVETDETLTYTVGDMTTATFDVPRNVQLVSTDGTQADNVVTITGADDYGDVMVEAITANGTTTVQGKKAFKTLTSIAVAAGTEATTLDLGFGNVLGLPFNLSSKIYLRDKRADETVEAWTVVVADTDQDSTAGDARGTITPNTTPNNVVNFTCVMVVPDVSSKTAAFGAAQFSG